MRGGLLLVLSCTLACSDFGVAHLPGPVDQPPGGVIASNSCSDDAPCPSGEACSRLGQCYPPEQLRYVSVNWTMNGMPASADTCASLPTFTLALSDAGAAPLAWAPVPCAEGKFTVDKMPIWYDTAAIEDLMSGSQVSAVFDRTTGEAMIDVPF
jgi:hypothetical protein